MPLKLVLSRRWACLVLFINCPIIHGVILLCLHGFQSKCESCTFFIHLSILLYQVGSFMTLYGFGMGKLHAIAD